MKSLVSVGKKQVGDLQKKPPQAPSLPRIHEHHPILNIVNRKETVAPADPDTAKDRRDRRQFFLLPYLVK
jgi:hypothetical protein